MLVAKRDPLFHSGAHDGAAAGGATHAAGRVLSVNRFVSVLQIVGSLLAIPVGIASGYSVYRANFSPEATCQALRTNILATLDKGVDATTRRMLVRRDVEAFEQSCGTVDPDANAAFKVLLAAAPTQPPVAATTAAAAPQPTEAARQAAPRPAVAVRQPSANGASIAASEPVGHDAASLDAAWVSAVRRALVTEARHPVPPVDSATAVVATAPPPAIRPMPLDIRASSNERAPAVMPGTPAPALPPAMPVVIAPAPAPDVGHPVPPASIPEIAPVPSKVTEEAGTGSRLGAWISHLIQ